MLAQEIFDVLYALEMQHEKEAMNNTSEAMRLNIIDPDVGKLLYIKGLAAKAKTMVEIGTGGGYAALWLALAAQSNGGQLWTYEVDSAKAEKAQANIDQAGLSASATVISADARQALRGETEPLDFIFLDAHPDQYETYFDVVYKRLHIGSLLIANRVLQNESALADYVSYVQNHPNLESVTVSMADGLEISVKVD